MHILLASTVSLQAFRGALPKSLTLQTLFVTTARVVFKVQVYRQITHTCCKTGSFCGVNFRFKMASVVHVKQKSSNLDKPLSKGKAEVNVATFALLFSEIVQYCQNRVYTVPELQNKLADLGQHVGTHLIDVLFLREKGYKREIKLLNMLLFIKSNVWKTLFGKEADKLEHANDDERTYYIIEKDSLVNRFISVPKDKGSLNCAAFTGGILESFLNGANFPAKVTVHWHKGTTFMIKFDESVIARDKMVDGK